MTLDEANEAMGNDVKAYAGLWGTYKGQLTDIWRNPCAPDDKSKYKAVVKISGCIEHPSQLSIYGGKKYTREPYKVGSLVDFNLYDVCEVKPIGDV